MFEKTFGRASRPANAPVPALEMLVVDTTDADGIRAAEAAVDLTKTRFIVSTKSGRQTAAPISERRSSR